MKAEELMAGDYVHVKPSGMLIVAKGFAIPTSGFDYRISGSL